MKLSNEALGRLPGNVAVPTYDRSRLAPGIVHIGLGNFHRAHQAWYVHRLMQRGEALDWAIIGAGVRPGDAAMRERLLAQDGLTTLIELDPAGSSVEVTGAMIDFVPVEPDNGAMIRTMSDPRIRIVAMTVTEGGYYRASDGTLDTDHPDIRHDAANPSRPRTAFGAIVAALKARRDAGHLPFTGQCCDNLLSNGAVLRQTVVGLARLSDPKLADWIDRNGSFPNSMVDCIVPATGPKELALVRELGLDDAAPVTHENFRQWVIEDDFCAGRPDWENVGATFSDNVHGYETMKIRLLNANHSVIAETGQILGVETIEDGATHPVISAFVRKLATEEIAPTVAPVPEFTPLEYLDLIFRRFSNPKIVDTTRRVAADGSSKHPGFLLPVVREQLTADRSIEGLALAEAIWARMCAGVREDGGEIIAKDPYWSDLNTAALKAREAPQAWLDQSRIYGDLAQDARFAPTFRSALADIWARGVTPVLRDYAARG